MDQETRNSFLLHCLSVETDEIETARLEGLSGSDWDEVIQQSIEHRVAPLFFDRFKTNTHVPIEVLQRLQAIYYQNALRNTRLYSELSKILGALESEGIPIIVLKGAALAELIYQNIALRPMVDVDLLAKSEDMRRIDKVLLQLGYKSHSVYSNHPLQWGRHTPYTNKVINVEVHPELDDFPPNLSPWINLSPEKIASNDAFILGPEHFLLHLCLHLDTHFAKGEAQLIWWCDIIEILEHYREKVNWDYVIRTAKEHQIGGVIHRTLHVINEWFDGRVPVDVLSQLKDGGSIISIDDVLHPTRVQTREVDVLSICLSFISEIPSIHNKIFYVFRKIFPRKEFMIKRYSVARPNYLYFYYLIRIGGFTTKTMKALYQLPGHLKSRFGTRNRKPTLPRSKMEKKV